MPEFKTFKIIGKSYRENPVKRKKFRETYVEPAIKKFLENGFEPDDENPDLVVTIGGDGSLFSAFKKYPDTTFFGLRAESKGASFDYGYEDVDKAIEKLMKKEYKILKLPKAKLEYKDKEVLGLNEVYFIRDTSKFPGADRFRIYKNGEDIYGDEIYADGCALVTPFGSAAYNRSYYGPILKHNEGMIVTPMAGCYLHETEVVNGIEVALNAKPKILNDDDEITVEIKRNAQNVIYSDNKIMSLENLKRGDKINFKKSKKFSKMIKFK